jgi:hypothetical protein
METRELNYQNYKETDLITNRLWWQKQGLQKTSTGYGGKIETEKMLKIGKRLYRVYCMIYSNSGSCYILKKGIVHFLREV